MKITMAKILLAATLIVTSICVVRSSQSNSISKISPNGRYKVAAQWPSDLESFFHVGRARNENNLTITVMDLRSGQSVIAGTRTAAAVLGSETDDVPECFLWSQDSRHFIYEYSWLFPNIVTFDVSDAPLRSGKSSNRKWVSQAIKFAAKSTDPDERRCAEHMLSSGLDTRSG